MEEQFYREAKEGWRFAADAARITDEEASSEDRNHTSGGVFVAVGSNLVALVEAEEGAIKSIPHNEGIIAQTWVNVRGGLRVFSVYFWHSEGWTPRNEALLEAVWKQARTTGKPWLIACDANMKEFTENLEDTEVPAPAHTSHDSDSEGLAKVASRKHSIFTHFPKDRNCEVCLRNKMTRAPCRKRTGTAVLRAEKLGDLSRSQTPQRGR